MKRLLLSLIVLGLSTQIAAAASNVRMIRIDTATNEVTLRNFGDTPQSLSLWWWGRHPSYLPMQQVTIGPDENVILTSPVLGGAGDDFELAIYISVGFSNPSAMVDYFQAGSGGHTRAGVAQSAGIWNSADFLTGSGPWVYTGDGLENGAEFWSEDAIPVVQSSWSAVKAVYGVR